MNQKAGQDRDMLVRFTQHATRATLLAGAATLAGLWLSACGVTTPGAALPDRSRGMGGSAGTTGGGGGASLPRLSLGAVVAANGRYVATGVVDTDSGSDSLVLTSDDGIGWILRYRGGDEVLDSVAYGDGHWVAAGWGIKEVGANYVRSRSLLVSEDATTWRVVASPESEGFHQVIWTGTEFLMRGALPGYDEGLWSSVTGSTWAERRIGRIPDGLAQGAPGLVGSGSGVDFSDDSGATWSSFALEPGTQVVGLWPEGGGFAGTALFSCCYGEIPTLDRYYSMYSADGRRWDVQLTVAPLPRAVVHRGETWVGLSVGDGGILHREAQTAAWSPGTANAAFIGADAVAAGERFVAVGSGIWSSEDGKTWTRATLPAEIAGP